MKKLNKLKKFKNNKLLMIKLFTNKFKKVKNQNKLICKIKPITMNKKFIIKMIYSLLNKMNFFKTIKILNKLQKINMKINKIYYKFKTI